MTAPLEPYEIRLYDHDGDLLSVVQQWNRLEFHQRINAPWNHQITIEASEYDPITSIIRNLKKDYFTLIYRTDPVTLQRDLVYEGLHNTIVDQARANGSLIFNLYGAGYTTLLNRRVVLPTYGLEHNSKSGYAETVLKGYVYDSAMGILDPDRAIQGLTIEGDASSGLSVEYNIRYILLSTVVENISNDGLVDYGIIGSDPPGEFELQVRPIWGTDRRKGTADPMIFAMSQGNMTIPIYSKNASEEKNYVYVGGQGQGVDRDIEEVSDLDAIAESPWGRKESFTDARHEDNADGLISDGRAYLEYNKTIHTLSFNVRQSLGTRWLRDWTLGDYVTAVYAGEDFDSQISEVGVVVVASSESSQVETINAEMVDVRY